jgi:hypothetical protein
MRTRKVNALALTLRVPSASAVGMGARWYSAVALCLVVVGCGAGPAASATARAKDSQGQFQLVLELPRTDWHMSDSITGEATLSFVGSGGADVGAPADGLIGFEFVEVGGNRHMGPASNVACAHYQLDAGQPITSPIKKSGAFLPQDPNADFYRGFLADPVVHLPAGDWTVTAVASLIDGWPCVKSASTPPEELQATVTVHVTP